MKVLQEIKPTKLKKIKLWGPSPYFLVYKMFTLHFQDTHKKGLEKGVNFDSDFLKDYISFEFLIHTSRKSYNIQICSGEHDEYCTPQFLNYLNSITGDNVNTKPSIKNMEHEVRIKNNDYLNFLFN